MKKILSVTLVLVIVLLLCACGKSGTISGDEAQAVVDSIVADAEKVVKDAGLDDVTIEGADTEKADSSEVANMVNPMTEHASLNEINDLVGSKLAKPPVMGVRNEQFFTIDCGDYTIADYHFEVSGTPYTFRCAPVADRDISGIYVGDGTAFSDTPDDAVIEFCLKDGVKAARWFTMDGQYVLSAKEPDIMDEAAFRSVAYELHNLTTSGMSEAEYELFYSELAGMYQDRHSQRAMAEITANGSDSVTIVVSWANGAACREEWTMTAKLMEDGLICYKDLVQKELTYKTETDYTEEVIEFPAEGWFEYIDGVLYWSGAGDDSCVHCEFEKYRES